MNLLSSSTQQLQDHQGLEIQKRFVDFLSDFQDENGINIYKEKANYMKSNMKNTMFIKKEHIMRYIGLTNIDFYTTIEDNYYRFEPFLRKGLHQFMFKLYPDTKEDEIYFVAFLDLVAERYF